VIALHSLFFEMKAIKVYLIHFSQMNRVSSSPSGPSIAITFETIETSSASEREL